MTETINTLQYIKINLMVVLNVIFKMFASLLINHNSICIILISHCNDTNASLYTIALNCSIFKLCELYKQFLACIGFDPPKTFIDMLALVLPSFHICQFLCLSFSFPFVSMMNSCVPKHNLLGQSGMCASVSGSSVVPWNCMGIQNSWDSKYEAFKDTKGILCTIETSNYLIGTHGWEISDPQI